MLKLSLIPLCSLWCALLAGWPSAAHGQMRATTGDLTGVVYDPSKAILRGVTVIVTNSDTGLARTQTTDGHGHFAFPALPPGTYRLRAELTLFAPQVRDGLVLEVGSAVDLELTMSLAGAAEQLTVTAPSPIVDTQRSAVATVVSQQQIESLPINGRNFISFSIITPGVTTDRTPQQGASATSGLTFAGQRARSNNITVDGVDNNDAAVGSVRATFSQDAVREFQVITNSYPAEFGKASGGVVNIVTKSGTNRLSGSAFMYFRDESLNANEYFERFDPAGHALDRAKAPYGQKQFGGTFGGPIRRDRSFYFVSFERLGIDANNFVNIDDRTIITLGTPIGTPKQILERAGFPVETGNVPYRVENDALLAKFDHQGSGAQNFGARFTYGDSLNENIEPWGGQVAKSRGALLDSEDVMFSTWHTLAPSNTWVNELRFQYARRNQDVRSLDPLCGGPCVGETQGGPTLEVSGFAQVGRQRFTPQPRHATRWQVIDSISLSRGGHQFKAGFDTSVIQNKNEALPLHFGGRYVFAATLPGVLFGLPFPTINAIQAVQLGLPAAYIQGYGTSDASYTVGDLSLFGQDDWRLGRHVTVHVGVRYQRQFWPNTEYTAPGLDSYRFPSDDNNVAPRLAAVWDPTGTKRTAVRAAYGWFYDNHITGLNGITAILDGGPNGVRTLVAQLPDPLPIGAWNARGRRLSEATVGTYPSLKFIIDPALVTPYAHHASVGIDREIASDLAVSASFVYARGKDQLGTLDYNPIVPALGAGRRPEDIGGRPGTSGSVLQYTSFGDTWYRGFTLTLNKRFSHRQQLLASYTVSKAEDNSTDYQSVFIPQNNGRGRDRSNPTGLPIGFDPNSEKGPSTQDQRHRFVLSGMYVVPGEVQLSTIVTAASGRPYTILAGVDLNGDGNGGAFPPDRARVNLADESTAVGRNSATLPAQVTMDLRVSRRFAIGGHAYVEGLFEVFNLFNRTNFTEINNIFGAGVYPANPLPTFGQSTQAGPPRQGQLAVRVGF